MVERRSGADGQSFAEWLRENMAKFGLSQADVARALEVDPAAVSRWVSGRSYPIRYFRQRLAVGFDVPEESVPSRHAGRNPRAGD
jgi:transcriptional regulator with XRE-family HTH domain